MINVLWWLKHHYYKSHNVQENVGMKELHHKMETTYEPEEYDFQSGLEEIGEIEGMKELHHKSDA